MAISPQLYVIRRQALARGFPDPALLMEQLGRFSQPSEVNLPVELLRAGAFMHTRGLVNAAVIQFNMDWHWPYWVQRQYNPEDISFIPRAFSLTHINLTQRNWTAIGLPLIAAYPLVDPVGMLTPFWDGWSLEAWFSDEGGKWLTAADAVHVDQYLDFSNGLAVLTRLVFENFSATLVAWAEHTDAEPVTRMSCFLSGEHGPELALAVRPANPEGISFIHTVEKFWDDQGLSVDSIPVIVHGKVMQHKFSDYSHGDVFNRLSDEPRAEEANGLSCRHGMATAAVIVAAEAADTAAMTLEIPLLKPEKKPAAVPALHWDKALEHATTFTLPDDKYQYLTDAALHTLVLLSPDDVFPGTYTYKRFWFRDAAFMIHALLAAGLTSNARRALGKFSARQHSSGYYRSQEGEWDSNGQVLWVYGEYFRITGEKPDQKLLGHLVEAGHWIRNKRIKARGGSPFSGLLPAGFSAEHLGPNDYYYWDNFWSVAGLRALADLCGQDNDRKNSDLFHAEADDLMATVEKSIASATSHRKSRAIPAAPTRRLDAAVIGSLVASYPLQLFAEDDIRLKDSLSFLKQNCLVKGGFYQQMIHSGINAYLTLHMAQAALRSGDDDFFPLMDAVADLASETGQWPEAVHTATGGGCMGDGQHGWAAAEWIAMMRNLFVRTEQDLLVLASGIPREWLEKGETIACENCCIASGRLSLKLYMENDKVICEWHGRFSGEIPAMEIRLPGYRKVPVRSAKGSETLTRE